MTRRRILGLAYCIPQLAPGSRTCIANTIIKERRMSQMHDAANIAHKALTAYQASLRGDDGRL